MAYSPQPLFAVAVYLVALSFPVTGIAQNISHHLWKPSPTVDERGFVDVWRLRTDIAYVEARYSNEDPDSCTGEGDPDEDEKLSARARKAQAAQDAACRKKIERANSIFQDIQTALNQAWMPVLMAAIRKGDPVAEVILRHCETTLVLDRGSIETTCDEEQGRREIARAQLDRIGFLPAIDNSSEVAPLWGGEREKPNQHEINQLSILKTIRGGALAFDGTLIHTGSGDEFSKRWYLIYAAQIDAPRAFTYPGMFSSLSLVRPTATPNYMTERQMLYYEGSNSIYVREPFFGQRLIYELVSFGQYLVAGAENAEFQEARKALLSEIENNIQRYLAADPRWGVFLVSRVSPHKWTAGSTQLSNQRLDASWQGKWVLEKQSTNWLLPMTEGRGMATIFQSGNSSAITIDASGAFDPFLNVQDCMLRYSGKLTYLPKFLPDGSMDPLNTIFGYYLGSGPHKDAVAPFNSGVRYKQVTMQCQNAENPSSSRVRFLLLAGDTLVEFGYAEDPRSDFAVRHFRRVKDDRP